MTENDRIKRNEDRLAELYPTFRNRLKKVIEILELTGLRPRIQEAWRSPADQEEAFRNGFSKLRFGFHNLTSKEGTPEALAVDLLDDDSPTSPGKRYLLQLAAAAEQAGLVSGIRWGLPLKLTSAINTAISASDWDADVKIGWDPTHVEPVGITIEQAKSGKRPV